MTVISNGTNLINNGALDSGAAVGSLILLATQTASSSSTITFSSGIDSTYKVYVFKFINIHPASTANLTFQANTAGASGFNETMTTTHVIAAHNEAGAGAGVGYQTALDQAQGTSFQRIGKASNGADECVSGELILFNPSSTTFMTHYLSRVANYNATYSQTEFTAGYFNTTAAIDEVQFKMSTGNMDAGTLKLYGVK